MIPSISHKARVGIRLKRHTDVDNLYDVRPAQGTSSRANRRGFFDHVCSYGLLKPLNSRVIVGPSLIIAHCD